MDTKRLLTMMLVSFAVIFGWQILMVRIYGPARPGQPTATTQSTTAPADATPTTSPVAAATQSATGPAAATTQAGPAPTIAAAPLPDVRIVSAATQPTTAPIENDVMLVEIASQGAGLKSVTLKQFDGPERKGKYTFQAPYYDDRPDTRALATRTVTINGRDITVDGAQWNLTASDSTSATFTLDLGLARIKKTYRLRPTTPGKKDFDLLVQHEIENTAPDGKPVNVKVAYNGVNTPLRESAQGMDLHVISGHDDGYQRIEIVHHLTDSYDAKTRSRDHLKEADGKPLLWTGASSVYFNAIIRPEPIEQGKADPTYLEKVFTEVLNPDDKPIQRRVTTVIGTKELAVAPGKSLVLPNEVYLGPRWRAVLNQGTYAEFPRDYDKSLVLTSGPCGFCTFNWLVNGLVALLNAFHWIFGGFAGKGDWGLAIIALVVLVRSLLHPITKKSQISMMRMGKLGPEVERLKKKYADDKDGLNREMMQLYKDQGIGAYLGCLPMFLQMPIWIALWSALNSTFELRQAPFLWGWTWINDLARPDRLLSWNPIQFSLPLFGEISLGSLNLLPVLLGFVFWLQQHYTPKPPTMTQEQETQYKMMKWMSLLFPLFLYNGPSGLNLYIMTSTGIGIIESKRIRQHIKEQEEAEKSGKIIVDAGLKKRRDDDDDSSGGAKKKPAGPKTPKGGIGGWLEQMQAKAEEIRRQAERGRK